MEELRKDPQAETGPRRLKRAGRGELLEEDRVWLAQAASSVGCLVWLAVSGTQGGFPVEG